MLHFKNIVHRVLAGYVLAAGLIYLISYNHAHDLIRMIIFDGARREVRAQLIIAAQKIDLYLSNLERDAITLARHIITTAIIANNRPAKLIWQDTHVWLKDILENNPALLQIVIIPNHEYETNTDKPLKPIGIRRNFTTTTLAFSTSQAQTLSERCYGIRQNNSLWTIPYKITTESGISNRMLLCVPYNQADMKLSGTITLEFNLDWLQPIIQFLALENGFFNMNIGEPFLLSLVTREWVVAPQRNTVAMFPPIPKADWKEKNPLQNPTSISVNKDKATEALLAKFPPRSPQEYAQDYATINTEGASLKVDTIPDYTQNIFESKSMSAIQSERFESEYWIAIPLIKRPWLVGMRFPTITLDSYLQSYFSLLRGSMMRDIILLGLAIFLILRITTRDLRKLISAVDTMRDGKFNVPLPIIHSKDEVGRLADAFLHMREALKVHIKQLKETTAAKERIESELAIAWQIQSAMVPKIDVTDPLENGYKLCAMLQPARQVGGDLYDFFLLDENRLCLVIGDVSDKGIPAALTMARVITLVRSVAKHDGSPIAILKAVNEVLSYANDECNFVTLFCAILEIGNGTLHYASGGHDAPLLLSSGQAEWLELNTGPAVGLFPDAEFPEHTIVLKPGDLLLLYTDGITEARNAAGELFTVERLQALLNRYLPSDPVRLIRLVQYFYHSFVKQAPISDDLTLFAIQYLPSSPFNIDNKTVEWVITLNNELIELKRVCERLGELLLQESLPTSLIEDMQLVTEEILVNIIQYEFAATDELQYIDIHINIAEQLLTLTFKDRGNPFNPLQEISQPDLTLEGAERESSSLGLFLVRNLVNHISYDYQYNRNVLSVSRNITTV